VTDALAELLVAFVDLAHLFAEKCVSFLADLNDLCAFSAPSYESRKYNQYGTGYSVAEAVLAHL